MNGKFRKVIFWLHLIAGLVAGIVILVMSVTGATLAFEKEIVAWAERGDRIIASPTADATKRPLTDLLARTQEKKPGEKPSGFTIAFDPNASVTVNFGRTNLLYVNPYNGEVRDASGSRVRGFMQTMLTWHRFLGAGEERRALGKAITGACNAAFLFLAVSGLYLWWPRQWTAKTFRAIGVVSFKLRGKARDWNWHNAVGLWCAPVFIVLTATALPISYRWASDLIYKLAGSPVPAVGAGPGSATAVEVPKAEPGTRPLGYEALLGIVQKEVPSWKEIAFQTGGARRGGREGGGESRKRNTEEGQRGEGAKSGGEERAPQAVTVTVKATGQWPLFASMQLSLDPFTGAVLRKEGFGDYNLGRQVRSWTRFLHTGEALGVVGKGVAGIASAMGALLVWTGFALAWRRFLNKSEATAAASLIVEKDAAQTAAKE